MKCYVSSRGVYLLSYVIPMQQQQCHSWNVLQIAHSKTCTGIADICEAAKLANIFFTDWKKKNQMLSQGMKIWCLICILHSQFKQGWFIFMTPTHAWLFFFSKGLKTNCRILELLLDTASKHVQHALKSMVSFFFFLPDLCYSLLYWPFVRLVQDLMFLTTDEEEMQRKTFFFFFEMLLFF